MNIIIEKFSLPLLIIFMSSGVNAVDSRATAIPLEDIRVFSEAFSKIKMNSIYDIDNKELFHHCISGMVKGIDSESSYLGKEKFQELKSGRRFSTGSIGVKLTMKNGYPTVVSPLEGTPADRAGLKSGDMILQIDNIDVRGVSLTNIISKLNGDPGTGVQLKVVQANKPETISYNLKREQIQIKSVKHKLLENNIGYIRISAFITGTGSKLKSGLDQLEASSKDKLNGLILDLRNNPGGLLSEAIAVADVFLASGLIAYTESRNSESEIRYTADPAQSFEGISIVVLVNEGTAAASEVVSGALRDHHRATILGKKTFGSGSIQTIMPLGDGTALKLTTARWIMPSGDFIHGKGIEPDVVVDEGSNVDNDAQLIRALRYLNK